MSLTFVQGGVMAAETGMRPMTLITGRAAAMTVVAAITRGHGCRHLPGRMRERRSGADAWELLTCRQLLEQISRAPGCTSAASSTVPITVLPRSHPWLTPDPSRRQPDRRLRLTIGAGAWLPGLPPGVVALSKSECSSVRTFHRPFLSRRTFLAASGAAAAASVLRRGALVPARAPNFV